MTRRVASWALVATLVLGVVTIAALEGHDVVVLETTTAGGAPRRTRTWIAEDRDGTWIEAASPSRPFVADIRRVPTVVVEANGVRRTCTAEIVPNPAGHDRVRRLLRERYGWADRWIGMLTDTHASLGVRLSCP